MAADEEEAGALGWRDWAVVFLGRGRRRRGGSGKGGEWRDWAAVDFCVLGARRAAVWEENWDVDEGIGRWSFWVVGGSGGGAEGIERGRVEAFGG